MIEKIKDKFLIAVFWLLGIAVFGTLFVYIPASIIYAAYDRIQNPPSEIYGERQTLDEWKKKCLNEDCDEVFYRLKTKASVMSNIGQPNEKVTDILAILEADEGFIESLTIELRDWETGAELSTFPQPDHRWYQLFKKYDTYESFLLLIDDEDSDTVGYEAQFNKDYILVTEESCDSRGLETEEDILGGYFLLDKFSNNEEYYHTLRLELKDGRVVKILL
jgi:hypothetical protein